MGTVKVQSSAFYFSNSNYVLLGAYYGPSAELSTLRTGMGKSWFTVVSMQNRVYSRIIIYSLVNTLFLLLITYFCPLLYMVPVNFHSSSKQGLLSTGNPKLREVK